jgi:hypothetical protein
MTLPSPSEARSRQTAYEVERHWWVTRLRELVERAEKYRDDPSGNATMLAASIDALIDERTS